MKMADKTNAILVVLVLLGAYMVFGGKAAQPTQVVDGDGVSTPSQQTIVVQEAGGKCESDGENTFYIAAVNKLNVSYEQNAPTVGSAYGNVVYNTATATGGPSIAYRSINVKCTPREAGIFALSTAAIVGDYKLASIEDGSTSTTVELSAPDSAILAVTVYDNTYTNTSTPTWDTDGTVTESAATAMNQGDSRSGFIDFSAARTASFSQFGGHQSTCISGQCGGVLFGLDTVTASVFADKDFSLTAPSGYAIAEIDCSKFPRAASANSLNRCWTGRQITSDDGDLRFGWSLKASIGTPGANDDPVLRLYDITVGQDDNGQLVLNTHTSALTDIGETNVAITFDNS